MKVHASAKWLINLDTDEQYQDTYRGFGARQNEETPFLVTRVSSSWSIEQAEISGPIIKKDGTPGNVHRKRQVAIDLLPEKIRVVVEDVQERLTSAVDRVSGR